MWCDYLAHPSLCWEFFLTVRGIFDLFWLLKPMVSNISSMSRGCECLKSPSFCLSILMPRYSFMPLSSFILILFANSVTAFSSLCLQPNSVKPLFRCLFHTLPACFRPYMYIRSSITCVCPFLSSLSLKPSAASCIWFLPCLLEGMPIWNPTVEISSHTPG